jgi:hypothetical protein
MSVDLLPVPAFNHPAKFDCPEAQVTYTLHTYADQDPVCSELIKYAPVSQESAERIQRRLQEITGIECWVFVRNHCHTGRPYGYGVSPARVEGSAYTHRVALGEEYPYDFDGEIVTVG